MVRAVPLMLLVAGTASASPARLDVTGDGCDLTELEPQVRAIVGGEPFTADARASVRVGTSTTARGVSARAWFDSGDGERRGPRTVEAATCDELVESLAVIIAMALPALMATPSLPPVVVAEPTALGLEAREEYVRTSKTQLIVAAAGGVSAQGWKQQLILGARTKRDARSLAIEVRSDAPREVEITMASRVDVWKSVVSVSPCLHAGAFGVCAIASAGVIRGSSTGLVDARTAFSPTAMVGGRLTWEHPFTRLLSLRLHVDAEAIVTTTRFEVGHMPVWVSNRFEVWGGAGVIARIP